MPGPGFLPPSPARIPASPHACAPWCLWQAIHILLILLCAWLALSCRLSILLTYLFSKSPLLMALVRLLRNMMRVITQVRSK